ncbi:MAG: transglycosylase SLT domain-containing protein [Solirubrobacteraceae bacterium]
MRRILLACAPIALLCLPAATQAAVPHTVIRGESLWSIAAASNLTTRALAAYNGVSPSGVAVLGGTIRVPSEPEAASTLWRASATTPASTSSPSSQSSVQAPAPMGAYTVRVGDTLAGIAARSGVAPSQIAWMNGLSVGGVLPAGMALKLPTGSPVAARRTTVAAPRIVPHTAPYATGSHVTAGTVGSIAAAQGVPASLATAVAYQESGFNNGAISSANARGVMQVMPGTWSYIQRNLGVGPLNPFSPTDNVRAGSAYLRDLLRQTGGNVSQAVAGYYQGLGSVRQVGMYSDTQRYVANVLALRARFGR